MEREVAYMIILPDIEVGTLFTRTMYIDGHICEKEYQVEDIYRARCGDELVAVVRNLSTMRKFGIPLEQLKRYRIEIVNEREGTEMRMKRS